MTIISELILDLRRMTNEPSALLTYSDATMTKMIEATARMDVTGKEPDEIGWIETYDIYKVASQIWIEKAAMVADEVDINVDGGAFSRSQKHAMYLKNARMYQGRSKAFAIQLKQMPIENLNNFGYQDLFYKDEIDEYEQNLE